MQTKQLRVCEICGRTSNTTRVFNSKKFSKVLCNRHWVQMNKYGKIIEKTRYEPNEFIIYKNYAEIILYDMYCNEIGKTKIDIWNIERCKAHRWTLSKSTGYAIGTIKGKIVKLHRFIMNTPPNMDTDHINHKILDNRKNNLRICTTAQNIHNSVKTKHQTSSKYKGVHFATHANKWRAVITINYKTKHLGYYNKEINAAIAYNKQAIKLHGKFASINSIEENI